MPAQRTTVRRVRLAALITTVLIVFTAVTRSDTVITVAWFHPIIPTVLIGVLIAFAMQAVRALLPTLQADDLTSAEASEISEIQRAVVAIDAATPRMLDAPEHLWAWDRIKVHLPQTPSARPRTIADAYLCSVLIEVPLPDHLLEPEEIVPAGGHARGIIVAGGIIALMTMYILAAFSVWMMVLFMLAILFIATSVAPLRTRIALVAPVETTLVAGQGWVREPGGRVWTTRDSMMIVTQRASTDPLRIFMTGPSGCIRRSFPHHTDSAFIDLWQRWNHPDPRPALAH